MTGQRFLLMHEATSLSDYEQSLCVVWGRHWFNVQTWSLPVYLNFYFLFVQNFTFRGGELGALSALSQLFPEPFACTWPSRFLGIFQSFSKSSRYISFKTFPLKIFYLFDVCVNFHCYLSSWDIKQLWLIVSDKYL